MRRKLLRLVDNLYQSVVFIWPLSNFNIIMVMFDSQVEIRRPRPCTGQCSNKQDAPLVIVNNFARLGDGIKISSLTSSHLISCNISLPSYRSDYGQMPYTGGFPAPFYALASFQYIACCILAQPLSTVF
jgi:hypothetical protein